MQERKKVEGAEMDWGEKKIVGKLTVHQLRSKHEHQSDYPKSHSVSCREEV